MHVILPIFFIRTHTHTASTLRHSVLLGVPADRLPQGPLPLPAHQTTPTTPQRQRTRLPVQICRHRDKKPGRSPQGNQPRYSSVTYQECTSGGISEHWGRWWRCCGEDGAITKKQCPLWQSKFDSISLCFFTKTDSIAHTYPESGPSQER